ncbi:MAG: hypothetical protein P4M13_04830 [Alphaproteobacteria bacterium]|nr:hypothetical protein [Alphaproteobacteria bacterium]
MTTRDLLRNQLTTQSLAPAARVNGTATGTTVDLRGFDAAVITVSFGAYTDGTHTPSVLQSADNVNFVPCVYGTDLDGPNNLTAVSSSAGANTTQQIAYIGTQRYLAVVMTTTGATTGALSAASVTAGFPHNGPTM